MLTRNITAARVRAQYRADRSARQRARLIGNQADHVSGIYHRVYGCCADREAIRQAVAGWFEIYPYRSACRQHIAIHEGAHFVAYEAEGMLAADASVYSGPFGRGGWGGRARAWNEPSITLMEQTTESLLGHARVTLAGPLAEALLADGDAICQAYELMEARALVGRAAEISGHNDDLLWEQTLHETVQLIERHSYEIKQLAALLMRRNLITREQSEVRWILARVVRSSACNSAVSRRAAALLGRLDFANVPSFREGRQ